MNKYFIMQPRQSGKTQKAIYEYLKNPEDSLFICRIIPKSNHSGYYLQWLECLLCTCILLHVVF